MISVLNAQETGIKKLDGIASQGYSLEKIQLLPFSPVTNIVFSIPDTSNVEIIFTDKTEKDTLLFKKYSKLTPGQYSYDRSNDKFNFEKFDKIILVAKSNQTFSSNYFISKYYPKEIATTQNKIVNPFSSLSLDGSHFVITEVTIETNTPAKIYLVNEDSTIYYVLFNESNPSFKKILITDEEYVANTKNKFPSLKLIIQPKLESGLYYYVYETKSKKYVHKFIYLK